MATKEELYVSYEPDIYRKNKSNILMCQASLLGTLKHINNLKILSRQRNDLKKELYKLFSVVLTNMDSLKDKMPTPKVPKTVQKTEEIQYTKESFPKRDDIEEELVAIQEKLKALNG